MVKWYKRKNNALIERMSNRPILNGIVQGGKVNTLKRFIPGGNLTNEDVIENLDYNRGYEQYLKDFQIINNRTGVERKDWELTSTSSPCHWLYFKEHGRLRPVTNVCANNDQRSCAYSLPAMENGCDPNQYPNRARHLIFDDCPYPARSSQVNPNSYARRAYYYGFYKTINVPNFNDGNLNDYLVDMSVEMVFHPRNPPNSSGYQDGPAFWFGYTAKQKSDCPDGVRYYNWWNDQPPGRPKAFPPESKRKRTGVSSFDGPNTFLPSIASRNWQVGDTACNWHRVAIIRGNITCKYVDKITFFVAFSDFVHPFSTPSSRYEGYIGDVFIDIKEIQHVRDANSEPFRIPLPMETWVDHAYIGADDVYY